MLRKKLSSNIILIAIVIVLVLLSVVSFVLYQNNTRNILAEKSKADMKKSTDQSIILTNSLIDNYFSELDTIAIFCGVNTGINDHEIFELLQQKNLGNTYSQIGVAGLDGSIYTGSGSKQNVSDQDYFQRAIKGERVVSNVVTDPSTGRDIIVLAIPIERDGVITGAACAQYDVQSFTDLLSSSQFKGAGATMIMQKNGKMVSSYVGMEDFDTFYDALEQQMEFRGENTLESFKSRVKNEESGLFTYFRNNNERYVYFEPVGINDWTMISLVMAETIDKQTTPINAGAFVLMIFNILLYVVILATVLAIIKRFGKQMEANQRDPLTRLYNKDIAHTIIERHLKKEGQKQRHACFFLDIDDFKCINDTYGHQTGDDVLFSVAQILLHCFRETDIIARFGGDEFIVWIKDLPTADIVRQKAEMLCNITAAGPNIPISLSIGIVWYPGDGTSYTEVMQHADEALYRAKNSGKGNYQFYSDPQ